MADLEQNVTEAAAGGSTTAFTRDQLAKLAYVAFYSPVLCGPQNIKAVVDEIDCCPGCDHVTNGGTCSVSERGDYCPNDLANTLRDISLALYGPRDPSHYVASVFGPDQMPALRQSPSAAPVAVKDTRIATLQAEVERWKKAFAAQSRKLHYVMPVAGVKEALAELTWPDAALASQPDAPVDVPAHPLAKFGSPDVADLGLYRVHWKSGGSSLAAIGMMQNGDRWIAPTNWMRPSTMPSAGEWGEIERLEPIDPDAPVDVVEECARIADEAAKDAYRNAGAASYRDEHDERLVRRTAEKIAADIRTSFGKGRT